MPAALAAAVLAASSDSCSAAARAAPGKRSTNSASAGYVEALLPVRLAAARERARDSGARVLAAARARGPSGPASASGQRLLAGEVSASGALAAARGVHRGPERRAAPPRTGAARAPCRPTATAGCPCDGLAAPLTLYAVPTASGVATIACLGASSAAAAGGAVRADRGHAEAERHHRVRAGAQRAVCEPRWGAPSARCAAPSAPARPACTPPRAPRRRPPRPPSSPPPTAPPSSALGRLTVSPAVQSANASLAASLAALGRDYAALAVGCARRRRSRLRTGAARASAATAPARERARGAAPGRLRRLRLSGRRGPEPSAGWAPCAAGPEPLALVLCCAFGE